MIDFYQLDTLYTLKNATSLWNTQQLIPAVHFQWRLRFLFLILLQICSCSWFHTTSLLYFHMYSGGCTVTQFAQTKIKETHQCLRAQKQKTVLNFVNILATCPTLIYCSIVHNIHHTMTVQSSRYSTWNNTVHHHKPHNYSTHQCRVICL